MESKSSKPVAVANSAEYVFDAMLSELGFFCCNLFGMLENGGLISQQRLLLFF